MKSVLWPALNSKVVDVSLSDGSLGYWTACNNFERDCTLPYCDSEFVRPMTYDESTHWLLFHNILPSCHQPHVDGFPGQVCKNSKMTNLESEGKSTCYILPKDIFWALSIHKHDDVIKWKQFPRYWPYGEFTVNGEFPTQRPVTRSFDVFFDLCPNKWLSKQLWGWWFETPSGPLCRHSNKSNNVQICLTRSHRMFFASIRPYILNSDRYAFWFCIFFDNALS